MTLGVDWITKNSAEIHPWKASAYNGSRIVAVAETGTNKIMYSDDGGDTWTAVPGPDATLTDVTWWPDEGVFVAVADSSATSSTVFTSSTGITWQGRVPYGSGQWSGVSAFDDTCVVVGRDGGALYCKTGSGLANWFPASVPTAAGWTAVSNNLGVFLAVAESGPSSVRAMATANGTSWVDRPNLTLSGYQDITHDPVHGAMIACSSTGTTQRIASTTDGGITWTLRTTPDVPYHAIGGRSGTVVALTQNVNGGNQVLYSTDLITWTEAAPSVVKTWQDVAYYDNVGFIALASTTADNEQVMLSLDADPVDIHPGELDLLKPGSADVLMFQTSNDGEIIMENGQIRMTDGFETMIYLALFGGNHEDPGGDDKTKQWWANFLEEEHQYRSETQYLLLSIPAIPANLNRIKQAAIRDLAVFKEKGIANQIIVDVTMPGLNRIGISITVEARGEEINFNYIGNWKAMA